MKREKKIAEEDWLWILVVRTEMRIKENKGRRGRRERTEEQRERGK